MPVAIILVEHVGGYAYVTFMQTVAATVVMIPEVLGPVRAPHLGFSAGALNLIPILDTFLVAGVTMTLSRGPMVKLVNWLIAGAGVRTERDVER